MDYEQVQQIDDNVVVQGLRHFDLTQTLDNGQAFRWSQTAENAYSGIVFGRRLDVTLSNGDLVLHDTTLEDFYAIWQQYFDLGRCYASLHDSLKSENAIKKALAFSPGLRLMRQDIWEVLISFILSQNSNIPRIKKMIELLCASFGTALPCGGFTFPAPQTLAQLAVEDLAPIRTGYRAAYIIDAARQVAGGGIDSLSSQPTSAVRNALLQIHGVGPKVADCVLLFGFGRTECFPLDVWMNRVMVKLYPKGHGFAENAGIAQQFLFHYARCHPQEFV